MQHPAGGEAGAMAVSAAWGGELQLRTKLEEGSVLVFSSVRLTWAVPVHRLRKEGEEWVCGAFVLSGLDLVHGMYLVFS